MAEISTNGQSTGWSRLPTELHDMILERSTWPTHSEARSLTEPHQLAVLATVSRDWKDFFEANLFQRLTLKTDVDIATFADMVQGRRRAYVEWIWLRVELPMYDCQQCHRLETREDIQAHQVIFTNLVWHLYDVLSRWKTKDVRNADITLELSAHSPSDAHHFNKDLRFRLHDTAWDRWDDRPVSPHNDPFHGWRDGKKVKTIPLDAKLRVFGCGLHFDYTLPSIRRLRMRLPRVSVVSSLVIRRQFPRTFMVHNALHPMIRSLTRLRDFTYEPWRGPHSLYQQRQDWSYAFLAKETIKSRRKTLKKVSIFQNYDEIFHRGSRIASIYRHNARVFAHWLARTSHHLEELHVANNIDAVDFFYPFYPKAPPSQRRWMVWRNLINLSLTTQYLAPGDTDLMIRTAAEAATRMPQLKIMEIWNYWGSRGLACIFRFRKGETEASIELVSTWHAGFTAAGKAAWTRVATLQRPLPLRCEATHWNAEEVEGQYSVLQKLALVGHLLHPVSLRQIKREDQARREARAM